MAWGCGMKKKKKEKLRDRDRDVCQVGRGGEVDKGIEGLNGDDGQRLVLE